MSEPASTYSRLTCLPCGPVCTVTSVAPSICLANSLASATDLAMRTPPLSPAEASLNLALPPPPAGVNLALHHPDRAGKRFRCHVGIGGPQHRHAFRNRHAEFVQQRLGLVFMNIHMDVPRTLVR